MRQARLAICAFGSLVWPIRGKVGSGYAGPKDAATNGNEETVSERLDELAAAGGDGSGKELA